MKKSSTMSTSCIQVNVKFCRKLNHQLNNRNFAS
eukprot:03725.XXX_51900_52001_1 [CDS] Oithona nana genome sequencing.